MARPAPPKQARPDKALATMVENSKAPAISRAAAALRLMGRSDIPIGVHTIARELGMVPSTCLHVLRALVAEHLVGFDPDTKRYSLDAGVWQYVEPVGGLSDSKDERYAFSIPLPAGVDASSEHLVTVRVYDRHENVGTAKVVVGGK